MLEAISAALSLLAIGVSIFVFVDGRTRYKRDVFLKIHEMMIGENSYRGRQLLLSRTHTEDSIEDLPLDERAAIRRTLALYDTLGLYLDRGYLVKEDVFSMWGTRADRAWKAAQPFVEHRERQTGETQAYPYFAALVSLFQSSHSRASHPESYE
jgi:hypothetical protein